MSWLSNILKKAAPIVATVSPDPVTKGVATALSIQYADQNLSYQRKLAEQQAKEREKKMVNYPGGFDPVTGQMTMPSTTTQQAGMGGFFSGVTDFFKGAGEVIGSAFGLSLIHI